MNLNQQRSTKYLVAFFVVVLVVTGGVLLFSNDSNENQLASDTSAQTESKQEQGKPNDSGTSLTAPVPGADIEETIVSGQGETVAAVITYVDGRFDPAVTGPVSVGSTVNFFNESQNIVWVASDDHPSHLLLPELDSGELEAGDAYQFTFQEAGEWTFHNHLKPSQIATVIVSEQ